MKCENCGCEHDGSYGSGRFCSISCRCSFNAKKTRHETRKFSAPKKRSPYGTWKCCHCGLIFDTKRNLFNHKKESHPIPKGQAWNKGLTKESNEIVRKHGENLSHKMMTREIIPVHLGKHLSDTHKKRISISMKKAQSEGRAHNIGESRWNNKPSWPEKWFMMVIENEFEDKNYVYERPFHRFSLDFAWEHKKKCIEIDGKQHQTFPGYKERDIRKDNALLADGWKVLRLPWIDIFKEPTKYIKLARDFIEK